ncbi:MAG: transcription antitermination factor NusB [Clostridia bacterium]
MSRKLARGKVLQALFQIDVGKNDPAEALAYITENALEQDKEFIINYIHGIVLELEPIDACINQYAKDWQADRLPNVDRNVLRIAVYEMLHQELHLPGPVVINEALELVKMFSSEEAVPFVNGLLDTLYKSVQVDG